MFSQTTLSHRNGVIQLPIPNEAFALFLDIDGTLAPIAQTPSLAKIPQETLTILSALYQATGGAIAMVSGRNVRDIDTLFAPHIFPAAGQHGLELRVGTSKSTSSGQISEVVEAEIAAFSTRHPQLLPEYKGASIAIHYRNAPMLETAVNDFLAGLVSSYPELGFQKGKMVAEVRLKGAGKGHAIEELLATAHFIGRTPIFAGDDLTDEDGFAVINRLGGISIKIGGGETKAAFRVETVEQLQRWLKDILFHLTTSPPERHSTLNAKSN